MNPFALEETYYPSPDFQLTKADIPRSLISAAENIRPLSDPSAVVWSKRAVESNVCTYVRACQGGPYLDIEILLLVGCWVLPRQVRQALEKNVSGRFTVYPVTSDRLRWKFACWLLAVRDLGSVDFDGLRGSEATGQEEALRRLKVYWAEFILSLREEVLADLDSTIWMMYMEQNMDYSAAVRWRQDLHHLTAYNEGMPAMPTDIGVSVKPAPIGFRRNPE